MCTSRLVIFGFFMVIHFIAIKLSFIHLQRHRHTHAHVSIEHTIVFTEQNNRYNFLLRQSAMHSSQFITAFRVSRSLEPRQLSRVAFCRALRTNGCFNYDAYGAWRGARFRLHSFLVRCPSRWRTARTFPSPRRRCASSSRRPPLVRAGSRLWWSTRPRRLKIKFRKVGSMVSWSF